ncbi:GNAT family N-acetyltransferase [Flavobacterium sp. SORGH_AS_0622]|jgi:glycosyltransferase involved in cell wall biosynthesis/RimJ/RimL family protein N-acetyltransferase|uniref:GNAT family N-acetyltransferase n=1 Tax=Flavobacterium sp. SORGH_AS_0622 TaxID=3041772 RepID=UPI0027834C09|nr:GNAT family N-acetyltransferase [Flavobacterium sp. SORGH_AS_0622]MDQ1167515.1 glycosyltransferase involved in cell wall biosynthesis/RimJ/RimL family protein N-acetyltransferase [Flavobacterium sp. SORGH_AS_0622]
MYKVLIRPLEEKDSYISWKWRNDSEIWKYTGSRPNLTITPEIELEWIKKVLQDPSSKRFAITADDVYVGNIQLTNIQEKEAEYHIFIGDKNFFGKGIAFLATQQIIRYALNVLQLEKIYLEVKNENYKAVSLYERSGFEVISKSEDGIRMILVLEKALKPKLSIFCMVYNHEPFLESCLEGLLVQKSNFDFEIVIGEDCSPDNSRIVIQKYAEKYPGKFKLLLHKKNVGAVRNQASVFQNCSGEYIAMCEGDDYWTNPLKIQKQLDFLESNPDFSICFTDYEILDENTKKKVYPDLSKKFKSKSIFNRNEIILKNFIPTLTVMFRKKTEIFKFLDEKLFPSDWFLHILNSKFGKIKFLDINSAVYRMHEGGVCSSANPLLNNKKYLISIDSFRKKFKNDYVMNYLFFIVKIKIIIESLKIRLKYILAKNE